MLCCSSSPKYHLSAPRGCDPSIILVGTVPPSALSRSICGGNSRLLYRPHLQLGHGQLLCGPVRLAMLQAVCQEGTNAIPHLCCLGFKHVGTTAMCPAGSGDVLSPKDSKWPCSHGPLLQSHFPVLPEYLPGFGCSVINHGGKHLRRAYDASLRDLRVRTTTDFEPLTPTPIVTFPM